MKPVPQVIIKITVSKKVKKMIKRLHRTGLWGTGTWHATAQRLLYKGLETIKMSDLEAWEK